MEADAALWSVTVRRKTWYLVSFVSMVNQTADLAFKKVNYVYLQGRRRRKGGFVFLSAVFESIAVQVAVVASLQRGVTQPAAGNGGGNGQWWLPLLLPPSHGMREQPQGHFLE